jgi:hypothetical protein
MTSATLPMVASSGTAASAADNNAGTRWESAASDPQYVQVDLGSVKKINRVHIAWETASAKDYTVQLSDNGTITELQLAPKEAYQLQPEVTAAAGAGYAIERPAEKAPEPFKRSTRWI